MGGGGRGACFGTDSIGCIGAGGSRKERGSFGAYSTGCLGEGERGVRGAALGQTQQGV